MEVIKKINVIDERGVSKEVCAILLPEEMQKVLGLIMPYLEPSYETEDKATIKNMQISSPKNINIEPLKGVKFKIGDKAQLELLPDKTGDLREFVVKAWRSVADNGDGKTALVDAEGNYTDLTDEVLVRLKQYCTELELNTYDKVNKNRKNGKIKFKNKDAWQKGVFEAASHDIRTYSSGDGTGGGIAVQISGRDSSGKENKFKIETDRTVDVDVEATADNHCGEGGKGIEIGTINSQMTSLYTKTYRFKGDAPIYGVRRGEITLQDDKRDYVTQPDDSKDIIEDDSPITWNDIIKAVKYLKRTQPSEF